MSAKPLSQNTGQYDPLFERLWKAVQQEFGSYVIKYPGGGSSTIWMTPGCESEMTDFVAGGVSVLKRVGAEESSIVLAEERLRAFSGDMAQEGQARGITDVDIDVF